MFKTEQTRTEQARKLMEEQPFWPPATEYLYRGQRILIFNVPGTFKDSPLWYTHTLKRKEELLEEEVPLARPVDGEHYLVGQSEPPNEEDLRLAQAILTGEVAGFLVEGLDLYDTWLPSPLEALSQALSDVDAALG